MNSKTRERFLITGLVLGLLGGGFLMGNAYAQLSRFDQATDFLVKAQALLRSAENPGVEPPFGYHRQRALQYLNRCMQEVNAARQYMVDHPPVLK